MSGGADRTTPPKKLKLPAVTPIEPKPHIRRREWVLYQHKMFGTMTFNAVPFMEPSQDFIKAGSTEIWEYINPNHDAHPIHVHLVDFQVLNRQPIDAAGYQADGGPAGVGELLHRTAEPAGPGRKRVPARTRSSPIRRR